MKKFSKYVLTVILAVGSVFTVFADESEEIEFEPIHATITPGSGTLKFEEVYSKKAMIATNGDALIFKSGKEIIMTNPIDLPINAMEDYTMEFIFQIPKFGGAVILNFSGYYILFSKKKASASVVDSDDVVKSKEELFGRFLFSRNLVKIPAGKEKNQFVCKIVKRKKIVTVFLNDQYVSEFNVKPMSPKLELVMGFFVGTEGELQSIRLDQGTEDESDN